MRLKRATDDDTLRHFMGELENLELLQKTMDRVEFKLEYLTEMLFGKGGLAEMEEAEKEEFGPGGLLRG